METNHVVGYIEPKTFPASMLNQPFTWVFPDGKMMSIGTLDEEKVLFALAYCVANASRVRKHYAIEAREMYDEHESPRRWILDRIAVRQLMRRLIELEDIENETEAQENKKLKHLTEGVYDALEVALDKFYGISE